jgi:hypothetical protein
MLLPVLAVGAGAGQSPDTAVSVSAIRPDAPSGISPSVADCRELRSPIASDTPCRLSVPSLAPGWKSVLLNTVLPTGSDQHPSQLGSVETRVYTDSVETLAPLVIYHLLPSGPGNSLRVAKRSAGGVNLSF